MSREPKPGDVRLLSDGVNHAAQVWTKDGAWAPLHGVTSAAVQVRPNMPSRATLVLELTFLNMVTPRERLDLELVGVPIPATQAEG